MKKILTFSVAVLVAATTIVPVSIMNANSVSADEQATYKGFTPLSQESIDDFKANQGAIMAIDENMDGTVHEFSEKDPMADAIAQMEKDLAGKNKPEEIAPSVIANEYANEELALAQNERILAQQPNVHETPETAPLKVPAVNSITTVADGSEAVGQGWWSTDSPPVQDDGVKSDVLDIQLKPIGHYSWYKGSLTVNFFIKFKEGADPTQIFGNAELYKTQNGVTTRVNAPHYGYSLNGGSGMSEVREAYLFDSPTNISFQYPTTYNIRYVQRDPADPKNTSKHIIHRGPEFTISPIGVTTAELSSSFSNNVVKTTVGTSILMQGKVESDGTARPTILERYNDATKTWDEVRRITYVPSSGVYSTYETEIDGTLRVRMPATWDRKEYISKTTKIEREKKLYSSVYGSKTEISHIAGYDATLRYYVGSVGVPDDRKLKLQKYANNAWHDVSSIQLRNGTHAFAVPKGSTNSPYAVTTYRFFLEGNDQWQNVISTHAKVTTEQPASWGGMRQEMYNHYKAWCPATITHINDTTTGARGAWGLAYIGQNYIEFSTKITPVHRKTVALHECMHMNQWDLTMAAGNTWADFQWIANQIHGTSGVYGMERNADCAANLISRNSYWGYQAPGECTGAKGDFAYKTVHKISPW